MAASVIVPDEKYGRLPALKNEAHGHVCRETAGMARRGMHTFQNARRRRFNPYEKMLDYWWELVHDARWENPADRARILTDVRDSAWFLVWALDDIIEFADQLPRRRA